MATSAVTQVVRTWYIRRGTYDTLVKRPYVWYTSITSLGVPFGKTQGKQGEGETGKVSIRQNLLFFLVSFPAFLLICQFVVFVELVLYGR